MRHVSPTRDALDRRVLASPPLSHWSRFAPWVEGEAWPAVESLNGLLPEAADFRFVQWVWMYGVWSIGWQALWGVVPPEWRQQARAFVEYRKDEFAHDPFGRDRDRRARIGVTPRIVEQVDEDMVEELRIDAHQRQAGRHLQPVPAQPPLLEPRGRHRARQGGGLDPVDRGEGRADQAVERRRGRG